MEPAKIRIRRIQILCLKYVGFKFGFVPRSRLSRFVQAKGRNAA